MRRDVIFYQIFKRSPRLFFDLVPQVPVDSTNYRFESVEVKESSFRIDGVFLPPEDAAPKVIFFIEVQFQRDETIYHRFFSEILLYLYRNRLTYDDWYGVVLFASRSLEPQDRDMHRSLLNSEQVMRVYLDELTGLENQSLGIQLMMLTIASEAETVIQAKRLLEEVRLQDVFVFNKEEIIEVITTIVVYKFVNLSRKEVEAMLDIKLEDVRVLREAKEEGRREMLEVAVPLLLQAGLTVEKIAENLHVSEQVVRQISVNSPNARLS
jgi:predicted transposase/invertase (TIGR01784 family)